MDHFLIVCKTVDDNVTGRVLQRWQLVHIRTS